MLAVVYKCLPSDLAVLWPLLSVLAPAPFCEEEGSAQWSRLHSHSLALGWPWKEEVEGFTLAVSAGLLEGHLECH